MKDKMITIPLESLIHLEYEYFKDNPFGVACFGDRMSEHPTKEAAEESIPQMEETDKKLGIYEEGAYTIIHWNSETKAWEAIK